MAATAHILIDGAGIGICIAVLALIGLRLWGRRDRRTPLLVIAAFVALLAGDMALDVGEAPGALGLDMALLPPLPVLLFVYVRLLTGGARVSWRHLIAPVAAIVCLLPLLSLDDGIKSALLRGEIVPHDRLHQVAAGVGVLLCWLIWMGLLIGYGIGIVRVLRAHDRRLRDVVSNVAGLDLNWVRGLMVLIGGAAGLAALDQLTALGGHPLLSPLAADVFEAGVALAFGAFGLQQDTRPAPVPAPRPEAPSYARSALTEADCDRILGKLDAAMTASQLWRDPALSLPKLAEAAGVKPNSVSQALNTRRACNFFDYVNGWRIRDACELLTTTDDTVLAISETVGFNAKSTFNAAFVRHTGTTPTRFRTAPHPPPAP